MKKISKFIVFFSFVFISLVTFYGCKLAKYKVTFNSEHIKYLSDKAYVSGKIPYGKEAHFQIIVPTGKEIKSVKVNGTEFNKNLISNNVFTLYNITANQAIEVEFQDLVNHLVTVELSGGVTFNDRSVKKEVALHSVHELVIPYYSLISDNNAQKKILASLKVNDKDVYRQVKTTENAITIGSQKYSTGSYKLTVSQELAGTNNQINVVASLVDPVYKNITLPATITEDYENRTSDFLVGQTYLFRVDVPAGQEIDEVKVSGEKIKHNLNDNTFFYKVEDKDNLEFSVTFKAFVQKYRIDLPAEITFKDNVEDNVAEHNKTYKLVVKPSDGKQIKELKVDNFDYISQFFTEGDEIVFNLKVTAAHKVTVAFEDKKDEKFKILFGNDTQAYVEFIGGNIAPNELYSPQKIVFKLKERTNSIFISVTANSLALEKQADGNYFFYLNKNVSLVYHSKPYADITFDKDTLDKIKLDDSVAPLFTDLGPNKLKFNIKDNTKVLFSLQNVPEGEEIDLIASTPKIKFNGEKYEFLHEKEDQTFKVVFRKKRFEIKTNVSFKVLQEFAGSQSIDDLTITEVEYGTVIRFVPIDPKYKVVKLDNTVITANSEGVFEFTVTGNHTLEFLLN